MKVAVKSEGSGSGAVEYDVAVSCVAQGVFALCLFQVVIAVAHKTCLRGG